MNPLASDSFRIRIAIPSDLSQIVDIWLENLQTAFDPSLPSPDWEGATQYWQRKLREQNEVYPIWVAQDESGLLGFLALAPLYSGHPILNAVFGEASLYIGKGHQGRGLGGRLLQTVVNHCDASPLKFIMATTSMENGPSQKALQRMGWQKMGMIPATTKLPQLPALAYYVYMVPDHEFPLRALTPPALVAV